MPYYSSLLDELTRRGLDIGNDPDEAVLLNVSRKISPSLNYALASARSNSIAKSVTNIKADFSFDGMRLRKDRIVVGYLSENYRNHPVAHLIKGLFKFHNNNEFEVICYSYGNDDESRFRTDIVQSCDSFVDIRRMNTAEAAEKIYKDGVCILVDLMGHTAGNRLDICALCPAPVQVTYLGFPGTTGAEFFDYIITDRIVSPIEHELYYSEKYVYMPHCYQANDNSQKISDKSWTRGSFGLPDDMFIFSSFNQSYKIEPIMFDCWMNILKEVPKSLLWLLRDNHTAEMNLKNEAHARGVDPDRLVFADKLPKDDHLSRMQLADLALDTRIYNGHTTTSDALWASIPVITLKGIHFASMVSASILNAIGLQELITYSLEEYKNLAVNLAYDRSGLKALREKIVKNRITNPLFDTQRFAGNIEKAFKEIWNIYRSGKTPRRTSVIE